MMRTAFTSFFLACTALVHGQVANDIAIFKKASGVGDTKTYYTPTATTLFSLNGLGSFALLPQSTFAAASHTHDAADVTSGVFNTARLGTGTANSSTYLRGDGTWQTISAGAGTWGSITGTLSDQTDLQSALDAKVPTSRTLTINGLAQDLSSDRSWTVGDLLSSGSYTNPSWLVSLPWTKITSTPTTIAGYGISDYYTLGDGRWVQLSNFNTLGDARWSLIGHTHYSADVIDASTGGNGASDAGLLLEFGATGSIEATVNSGSFAARFISNNNGNAISAQNTSTGYGIVSIASSGYGISGVSNTSVGVHASSGSGISLRVISGDALNVADLAHFENDDGTGVEISNDGGFEWTSASGGQTTATNLPVFGSAAKGVVPASGGGTSNFLRADGSWAAPAGAGTVTSVAVSGANGIGVSGSPITTSGTISLSLGAITPTSVNGITLSGSGSLSNSGTSSLTGFTGSGTSSGTNTGDQTITNSSDATSHTVTLSASGGSVQLIEGSNITLTTGGTGSAGTVTIASTGGGGISDGDVLSVGLTFPGYGLKILDTDADNTLSIVADEDLSGDRSLRIRTEDDDRILTISGDADISGTNTGDQTSIVGITGTLSEFNTALTGADFATGGGTVTGTSSGTNTGDQTITNSSDATSHTVTLSASGGSVQLIEGSNITLTTGGTGSAGTVTIASTGGGSFDANKTMAYVAAY